MSICPNTNHVVCMHLLPWKMAVILVHSLNRRSFSVHQNLAVAKLLLCCDITCKRYWELETKFPGADVVFDMLQYNYNNISPILPHTPGSPYMSAHAHSLEKHTRGLPMNKALFSS